MDRWGWWGGRGWGKRRKVGFLYHASETNIAMGSFLVKINFLSSHLISVYLIKKADLENNNKPFREILNQINMPYL